MATNRFNRLVQGSRRYVLISMAAVSIATAAVIATRAEEPRSVVIFTLLSYPILDDSIVGIKRSLADAGYSGTKVKLREVNANGQTNLLDAFAKEILAGKPDVVVPVSTPVAQAVVHNASPAQAIVYSTVTDPRQIGMDKHPQNMTGVSDAVDYEANIKLIKQLLPHSKRMGMIYNPGEANSRFGLEHVTSLAPKYGLSLSLISATNSTEALNATRTLIEKVDVIYIGSDNNAASAMSGIVAIASERQVPVIASDAGSVRAGALAAVSVDYQLLGRRVGQIVAEILRSGKRPGTIAAVSYLGDAVILNGRTARAIGYSFPPSIMSRHPQIIQTGTP